MARTILFITSFLIGCSSGYKVDNLPKEHFKLPVIIQTKLTGRATYFNENNLSEVWPKFVGQFKFTDTIYYDGERERRMAVSKDQFMWEQKPFKFDTLSSDGLQIMPDYNSDVIFWETATDTVEHYYYPIYIVNETTVPKIFIGKDSYVFAIQEAMDSNYYSGWYAIEGKGFDFCGNGHFRRKILPGEFIMFLLPKYSGSERTFLRVRAKIGDNIILSKPFKGEINSSQFIIKKGSLYDDELKDTKNAAIYWIFYGANIKTIENR